MTISSNCPTIQPAHGAAIETKACARTPELTQKIDWRLKIAGAQHIFELPNGFPKQTNANGRGSFQLRGEGPASKARSGGPGAKACLGMCPYDHMLVDLGIPAA